MPNALIRAHPKRVKSAEDAGADAPALLLLGFFPT